MTEDSPSKVIPILVVDQVLRYDFDGSLVNKVAHLRVFLHDFINQLNLEVCGPVSEVL